MKVGVLVTEGSKDGNGSGKVNAEVEDGKEDEFEEIDEIQDNNWVFTG
jgi:hypothetical protein